MHKPVYVPHPDVEAPEDQSDTMIRPDEVQPGEFETYRLLWDTYTENAFTAKEAAAITGRKIPSLRAVLNRLTKAGLIRTENDPEDKRRTCYFLLPAPQEPLYRQGNEENYIVRTPLMPELSEEEPFRDDEKICRFQTLIIRIINAWGLKTSADYLDILLILLIRRLLAVQAQKDQPVKFDLSILSGRRHFITDLFDECTEKEVPAEIRKFFSKNRLTAFRQALATRLAAPASAGTLQPLLIILFFRVTDQDLVSYYDYHLCYAVRQRVYPHLPGDFAGVPPDVAALMSRLTHPEHWETIMVPTCGDGTLPVELQGRANEFNLPFEQELNITATIHPDASDRYDRIITRLWLAVLGIFTDSISLIGGIKGRPPFSPDYLPYGTCDAAVAAVPWPGYRINGTEMLRCHEIQEQFRWGLPADKEKIPAEWFYVSYLLACTDNCGPAVVLMEEKALDRSGSDAAVRNAILASGRLSTVIFLPPGLFYAPKGNRSRTAGTLLLFSPEPVESVLLINATMRGAPSPYSPNSFFILTEDDLGWITHIADEGITIDRVSCMVSGAELAASGGITRLHYFPAGDGSGRLSTVPFSSVAVHVHRGLAFETEEEEYSFEYPFIVLRAGDLDDHEIEPAAFRFAGPNPQEIFSAALRPGDLLVGLLQEKTTVTVYRGNELFCDADASLAGEDLFLIRPTPDLLPDYGALAIRSALKRRDISAGEVCDDPESVLTGLMIPLLSVPDQYRVCAAFRDHPALIRYLPECAEYLSRGEFQYLTGKDVVSEHFIEYPPVPGERYDALEEYLREKGAVLCAELIDGLVSCSELLTEVCRVVLFSHRNAFFDTLRTVLSDPAAPDPVVIEGFRLLFMSLPEEAGALGSGVLLKGAELFLPEAAPDGEYMGPFEELMGHLACRKAEISNDAEISGRYFTLLEVTGAPE